MSNEIMSTTQRKRILANVEADVDITIKKYSHQNADEIDALLNELHSNVFPAGNPVIKARKSEIKNKFRRLLDLIGEKGEDWDGLA